MKYFDPERPVLSGQGQYVDAQGRPLAVLQPLEIFLRPDGQLLVSVWLKVAGNKFQRHECVLSVGQFTDLLEAYRDDPEATYKEYFLYNAPAAREEPKKLTLEDLGL